MHQALLIIQMVSALLMILCILLQERGGGLGEAISGVGGAHIELKKRGAEKVMSMATSVLIFIFLAASLLINFI